MTPNDPCSFVGDPPLLWRPDADEVHVSVVFTWDVAEGRRIQEAWAQYYPVVRIGGPAVENGYCASKLDYFEPGVYIRSGITFTSRGCNNCCPWCLAWQREGRLRTITITPGYIVQDNNFLQCALSHRLAVYQMLSAQKRAAVFSGGLQPSRITDRIADELRGLRISQVFLAADTEESLKALSRAVKRLAFLGQRRTRCYVMIAYGSETLEQAEVRLRSVWELGAMPFAQLYQPPSHYINYSHEWKALARIWSRPAIMKGLMERSKP